MKLVAIISFGGQEWGEFALSACLSIKANDDKQKIMLVTDGTSLGSINDYLHFFDIVKTVDYSQFPTPQAKSFYAKLDMYELAMSVGADEVISLDADCLMLPSHSPSEWFNECSGHFFTAWNNDVFDFKKGESGRADYTFWCNPLEAQKYFGLEHHMPQVNTSMFYFSKSPITSQLFSNAKKVWYDEGFEHKTYKEVKPDELCFNIACSMTNVLPHKTPFYPIFFQFANETQDRMYIEHCYKAMGFAGQLRPSDKYIELYNQYANYYREFIGVPKYEVSIQTKNIADYGQIRLPNRNRTIVRRGELINSDGGAFNPSAVIYNGEILTVVRKEKNLDVYKGYLHTTATPHWIEIDTEDDISELDESYRREDFRLFNFKSFAYTSYTKIKNGIARVVINKYGFDQEVNLPIELNDIEKNWLFFEHNNELYCIYSLSPYQLFKQVGEEWVKVTVKQPKIDFFHKKQICNSTHPIRIGDHYLVFFHTKESGIYFHGAMLLSAKTLEITHYTKNSIFIKDYAEGFQNGLIYVSGCLHLPDQNIIRVYYGEADSHSCYCEFNQDDLINAIKKNKVQ